jgi:hypothetical protein
MFKALRRAVSDRRRRRSLSAVVAILAASALIGLGLAMLAGAPASATVPAPPAGWSTVFSDGFAGAAGSGVDTSKWKYDTGAGSTFGTGEIETMTDSTSNVHLDGNGDLDITALESGGNWTSGRIQTTTANVGAPAGGELEVTASIKQPTGGLGYWPAFWMLGPGQWPENGELDILEDVNALSEHSGTMHCGTDPGGPCDETDGIGSGLLACSGCQSGFHTYTVIVNRTDTSAESVTWYLDGRQFFKINESQVPTAAWQAAIDHKFSIILDLAIGGGFPNGACRCTTPTSATTSGGTMSVRYVAAYQSTGSAPPPGSPSPGASVSPSAMSAGTGTGSGTSCTRAATSDISAACYSTSQGAITTSASGDTDPAGVDGKQLSRLSNGDWVEYPGVDFGSGSSQFDARVASGAPDGVSGLVKVGIGSPTNIVGTFAVGNTGGWSSWRTVPANISEVTGTQNVYLVFSSTAAGNPPFVSLHYFDFPSA